VKFQIENGCRMNVDMKPFEARAVIQTVGEDGVERLDQRRAATRPISVFSVWKMIGLVLPLEAPVSMMTISFDSLILACDVW
jgi:hypothetical protein